MHLLSKGPETGLGAGATSVTQQSGHPRTPNLSRDRSEFHSRVSPQSQRVSSEFHSMKGHPQISGSGSVQGPFSSVGERSGGSSTDGTG